MENDVQYSRHVTGKYEPVGWNETEVPQPQTAGQLAHNATNEHSELDNC